ncbi:MAG: CpsD/CapB family tyrosine-protein kinase [Clostridia bacterium]|nr:CpsD/CapB family tyrosine-protein kinase [Clostridia bacterium]
MPPKQKKKSSSGSLKLVNNNGPSKVPFSVLEAYKNIRVHLTSMLANIDGNVVAISSPNASEGKSTTAVNTAIILSQLEKKVLLIDADIRRASIHKKLKMEKGTGCMDVVLGKAQFEDVILKYNPFLDVMTAGTSISNSSEIFSFEAFDTLLANLRTEYDYIIIDTPPVNLVSDALVISKKCDGLLLVVRTGVTTYDAFIDTLEHASVLDINILGVVMNGVDGSSGRYGKYGKYGRYGRYGKYGRYGYYYGYGSSESSQ